MSIMYVLKSVAAAPGATLSQLVGALDVVRLGRRACDRSVFNSGFGEEIRLRTLAVILNNGGLISLRICKQAPQHHKLMLRLARFLYRESLSTFYFAGAVRGALTCANDLKDEPWAKELLTLLIEREGPQRSKWSRGINADLDDPQEWGFLKEHRYWTLCAE